MKPKNMNVEKILEAFKKEHGFDGFYDPDCGISDATGCLDCQLDGSICVSSVPAYKGKDGKFYPAKGGRR